MTEKHWQNAYELYSAAADLPAAQRSSFLGASGASEAVIQEVRLLLRDLEAGEGPETPERPALEPGTKIGRNVLKALIGKGGMSSVYSAWDPERGREVAVKLIDPQIVAASGIEKATREARAASALNHPNIITVYEVIRHELGMAIVMELVDGLALRSVIGRPHRIEELAAIGAQAALALDTAHAHGIVHRDVKPENIMLQRDGRVKILDFGLAGWLSLSGFNYQSTILSGTLRYMSPEQGTDGKLTAATDVFSLGLVLYELATGRHAFPGDTPFDTMQAIASQDAPPPSRFAHELPAEFDALVKAMLRRAPGERPTARRVAETLSAMPTGNHAGRAARAPKWLLAAGGLALVAAAASYSLFSRLPKRAEPALRQITSHASEDRITAAAISPDASRLAYASAAGLTVRKLPSNETETYRLPSEFRAARLAWFPNGEELAISGLTPTSLRTAVWLFSLNGGQLRLLREDAFHAAVSPDGTRIAFTSAGESEIWVCGASGQSPVKVIGSGNDTFPLLLWSPGGKLAYVRRFVDPASAAHQQAYETYDVDSAKLLSRYLGINLQSAAYLTPTRLAMLRFNPQADAFQSNLWEADTDPATGGMRGAPRQLSHFQGGIYDGLTAPREGSTVSLIRAPEPDAAFVADFDTRTHRLSSGTRLTSDEHPMSPQSWTADGQWIVFQSHVQGSWDLLRQRAGSRTAEALVASPEDEFLPRITADGEWVMFARCQRGRSTVAAEPISIWRVPAGGGTPVEVHAGGAGDEFRCALPGKLAARAAACVLRSTGPNGEFVLYALDPGKGKGAELGRTARQAAEDWDLSPDGTTVAFSRRMPSGTRIHLMPLYGGGPARDVTMAGLTAVKALRWSADGAGWFLTANAPPGGFLFYGGPGGVMQSLGVRGWAIPSPDGRRLAYLDQAAASNVFFVDLR